MAKIEGWTEGARSGNKSDVCPGCYFVGPLVWDFQKMGKHRLVFCAVCNKVHVDGDLAATATVHKEET